MKDFAKTITLATGVSVGAAFLGVAAWVGLEKTRQIAIDNCESRPAECPNRDLTFTTPAGDKIRGVAGDEIADFIKKYQPKVEKALTP